MIRNPNGEITGVVVASDYLSGDLAERSRRMTKAYEDYTQLACFDSRSPASISRFS